MIPGSRYDQMGTRYLCFLGVSFEVRFVSILIPLYSYKCKILGLVHMSPLSEPEGKVVSKEPDYLLLTIIFMTVLIRGALVEDNTATECIRTVAATYGCKILILQLYEYEAN